MGATMATLFHILLLLIGYASAIFNIDKLVAVLDQDGDGNITRSNMDSVFTSRFGSNATGRCKFMDLLVNEFQASQINASALFDTIQAADRQVTVTALTNAFMGSTIATNTNATNLMAVLSTLYNNLEKIISRPADFTVGYTFWPYSQFEVTRWASSSDLDQNGNLTRMEISSAMRSLDEDGDWSIRRCEYINSMIDYKQHSDTASKVYDVIFKDRDINWADVDSDFLMIMMGSTNGIVTRQQFVDFFTMQNLLAAGLAVSEDGYVPDGCDTVLPFSGLTFLCVTSSVLALFNRFLLY